MRERRTAPTNGAARIAFVLCVASALSRAVEAATTTYVGNCDDIASHTGSSSVTVQAFDFLQCCSSSLAKGFSYSVATNVGTTYTAKVVKSSSNSGTMFGGHCEVYNGGGACSGSHCIWEPTGFGTRYYCDRDECCWEGSADNWCLNVQCRNNDGSACTFNDFSITFDAHTVSCAAGTDYDSNRGEYLDGATCQSCPANSVGAGGTATTCTCAANYWAKKSGNTWTCELCSGGRTKAATSTVPGSGAGEIQNDVCNANCAAKQYWDGERARPARLTLSATAGRRRSARVPRTTGPSGRALVVTTVSYALAAEPRVRPRWFPAQPLARMRTPSVLTRLRAPTIITYPAASAWRALSARRARIRRLRLASAAHHSTSLTARATTARARPPAPPLRARR